MDGESTVAEDRLEPRPTTKNRPSVAENSELARRQERLLTEPDKKRAVNPAEKTAQAIAKSLGGPSEVASRGTQSLRPIPLATGDGEIFSL